ncbi:MAG: FISUMP domain-containing protein [Lentimicrobium sp.]
MRIKTLLSFLTLSAGVVFIFLAFHLHSCGPEQDDPDLPPYIPPSRPARPEVNTKPVTYISNTSATGGGVVSHQGGAPVTAKGICWSTISNPTISNPYTVDGAGIGSYTSSINGLTPNTTYYMRAYATSSVATSYGLPVSFTTTSYGTSPSVFTNKITDLTDATATCGGAVVSEGYTAVTARGVCWNTSSNPTLSDLHTNDGSGLGSFTSDIAGLAAATSYAVRAYATNGGGTAYGEEVNFTTTAFGAAPTVTTDTVTNITETSAISGGEVVSQGSSAVISRGVCWNTAPQPVISDTCSTDGSGAGSFTSTINGLTKNSIYYVRAYATNDGGTAYGNEFSFTASGSIIPVPGPCPGIPVVTDPRDGQEYPTVQIGNQCWMKKNMNYPVGDSWCYDGESSNCGTYGRLYTWESALSACPTGWQLPGNNDFGILISYLGGEAGGMLKEEGFAHWLAPNTGATNLSGFTALPGGFRMNNGSFNSIKARASFWSSTEAQPSSPLAFYLYLTNSDATLYNYSNDKTYGFSVRCLKN